MSDKDNKSDHVNTEKSLDTVSAGVSRKKRKVTRRQLLIVVGAVVSVAVIVVICTILWQRQSMNSTGTNDGAQQTNSNEAELDKLKRQVEDTRAEELKTLIGAEADKQAKALHLNELMLIHFNRGEFELALPLGLEAEKTYPTSLSAGALGDIYSAMKEYKSAAKYYGIAMDRSEKPASKTERSSYNEYEYLKKQAEDAQ